MKTIIVNACAYCGQKSQGNYKMTRDGAVGPQLPLCDDCGAEPYPTLQQIWARISLVADDGELWGPTVEPCDLVSRATA